MRISLVLVAQMLFLPVFATAGDADLASPAPSAETDESGMAVVVVTGEVSGPALWKVSSGEHVLWILGEISPFPRRLKWRSREFDRLLRHSQELLLDFSGYWWVDEQNSAALTKAARLPDGTTLKEVIAPELHVRVEETAGKFGKPSLDRWRPFSATNQLVTSAMKTLELNGFSARFAAARMGEYRRRKITYFAAPELPFEERLRQWQHPAHEVCLERLVTAIEDGGAGVLRLANAWAVGDIGALRELVPRYSFSRDGFRAGECAAAMHGGEPQLREYNVKRNQAWLAEAKRALRKNRRTMAVVLMSELFEPDGYLAALRAEGYDIVEPD